MGTEANLLSGRLIHLIEVHQHEITDRIIHEIRCHSDLNHIRKLPDVELRDRNRQILAHLGHWLAAEKKRNWPGGMNKLGKPGLRNSSPWTNRYAHYSLSKTR